jgi:hypothetical protein
MTELLARSSDPERGNRSQRLPMFLAAFGIGFAVGLVGIFSSDFGALGSGDTILQFMLWPTVLAMAVGLIGGVLATAAEQPIAATVSGVSFSFLIGLWTPIGVMLAVIFFLMLSTNSRRQ